MLLHLIGGHLFLRDLGKKARWCGRVLTIKKSGIEHDVQRNDGFTHLRVADIAGNEVAVKALLELGENINALDGKGIMAEMMMSQ